MKSMHRLHVKIKLNGALKSASMRATSLICQPYRIDTHVLLRVTTRECDPKIYPKKTSPEQATET